MNEIEYMLHKENREKKITGKGVYNRAKRGGGKSCRFPSDYMTKKQKEGMNSKVETVKLNEPMGYNEFKRLNDNLKREYLENLVKKHGARQMDVAEMFGIGRSTMNQVFKKIQPNVKFAASGSKTASKEWLKFISPKEPTPIDKMLTPHDWCRHDNEEKPKVNAAEEIRKEAEELGIKIPDRKISIIEGNISIVGYPAQIFKKLTEIMDINKTHEITVKFKEIE